MSVLNFMANCQIVVVKTLNVNLLVISVHPLRAMNVCTKRHKKRRYFRLDQNSGLTDQHGHP